MKRIVLICLLLLTALPTSKAATLDPDASVAVMDFGVHQAADPDVNLMNAERASSEYIIARLIDSKKFTVMDKDIVNARIAEENLNITGLIDPDTARRLGEILGVRYLIYGNVVDMVVDFNVEAIVKVRTVKCHIVARIMDVETGNILMAAKGEGKSKSANVSLDENFFMIGTVKVSQTSVHNALQKASFQAVDLLIQRLYGK